MNKTEFLGSPSYAELANLSLSGTQRDILAVLAAKGGKPGIEIRNTLNEIRDIDKSRSCIYGELDDLDDKGLVEIGEHDGRTNSYSLSYDGEMQLIGYFTWVQTCIQNYNGELDDRLEE